MSIEEVIERIESNSTLPEITHNGLLVWPVIRFPLLQLVIDKECGIDSTRIASGGNLLKTASSIMRSYLDSPIFAPKADVVVFNTAASNIKRPDGSYFNRICGYLILELSENEVVSIEEPNAFSHPYPRKFKKVYSKLPIMIGGKLAFLIASRNTAARKEIESIADQVIRIIDSVMADSNVKYVDDELAGKIREIIVKKGHSMGFYYRFYKKFLKRIGARLLIVEDGYYGLDKALLIKAAKEQGIKVIEPQHGFLNESHHAYSFGSGVIKVKEFKTYYPDVLLTYGKFWAQSTRIPNQTFSMGNPHLSAAKEKFSAILPEKTILVIGSGVAIDETIELLIKLRTLKKANEYKILFRPHPLERDKVALYKEKVGDDLLIDTGELYHSICSSEIIIGETSTVIFEAVAFQRKVKLFLSSYSRAYYNEKIRYIDSFDLNSVERIFEGQPSLPEHASYYWGDDNWQARFKEISTI